MSAIPEADAGHPDLHRRLSWAGRLGARSALLLPGIPPVTHPGSDELDLRDSDATATFFAEHRPEVVIDAAALVAGIGANSRRPADFLSRTCIQINLLDSSVEHGVQRFLFPGIQLHLSEVRRAADR